MPNLCSYLCAESQESGVEGTLVVVQTKIASLGAVMMPMLTAVSGISGMGQLKLRLAHIRHLDECPIFWYLWATLEEELSWATH